MKKYLFLALAGLIVLAGCPDESGMVVNNTTINYNNYGDDDSADEVEEPTPADDDTTGDDDSAEEAADAPEAFVYWEGWSSFPSVDTTDQPEGGATVIFGRWGVSVFGEPGTVVSVVSMNFVGLVASEDWDDGYQPGEHGGIAVSEAIGNCEVFNGYNGQAVWAARSVGANGVASFSEGKPFAVEIGENGEGWALLNLQCTALDPSGLEPGEEASVMFNLDSQENITIRDEDGQIVPAELLSDNSNPGLEGNSLQFPRSAVFFYAPDIAPYAWVTQNAATPNGAAVPGVIGVLTFNVSAEVADLEVHGISTMLVTSDNAGSGWNTCDELGDGLDGEGGVQLYEVSNMETPLGLFGAYSPAGTCANPAGGGWVVGGATNTWWSVTIPAGTAATFAITAETTGASAVMDDQIQATIASLTVSDIATGASVPVVGLPLPGGTLVF